MVKNGIKTETLPDGRKAWQMFAHRYEGMDVYCHIGPLPYVQAHMLHKEDIYSVQFEEDPEGRYWGWIDAEKGEDAVPCMIWGTQFQFKMCFTYGPDIEVEKGCGRIVRLTAVPGRVVVVGKK